MTPSQVLLHETIIRALQMVVNVWKKYLKDEKRRLGIRVDDDDALEATADDQNPPRRLRA